MRKLYYNGTILTMESPQAVGAVLTEGDRILAVGDLKTLHRLAGSRAEEIDLEGGALLPGFVDGYSDFFAVVRACLREEEGSGGRHAMFRSGSKAFRSAIRRAAARYAARGITVLHQCDMTAEMWRQLSHAELPMPLMAVADIRDYEAVKRAAAGGRGEMRLCGVSLTLDAVDEYGSPTGELALCDRALGYALHMAAAEGIQPVVRAASEAAIAQFLRVLRAMIRVCPRLSAVRPVLLDARALSPILPERVRDLGVFPCFAADVLARQGDDYLRAWGMERAARLLPLASVRQAGVPFTLCHEPLAGRSGTLPEPLTLLRSAVTRQTARGVTLGAGECASVYDALRALTVFGAWRYRAERDWGSIRAGLRASFVLLDRDPLTVSSRELGDIRVRRTFGDGEELWRSEGQEISTLNERVPSVY